MKEMLEKGTTTDGRPTHAGRAPVHSELDIEGLTGVKPQLAGNQYVHARPARGKKIFRIEGGKVGRALVYLAQAV